MFNRLLPHLNDAVERHFPEQRIFLKSDHGTHFLRLRPGVQVAALSLALLGLAWTIVVTALIMMQTIGAGSAREESLRQGAMFEMRLGQMSADRDRRMEEAASAQDRYNFALAQVSSMQGLLLASEDRRRELETGIDAVQDTLRRAIHERDQARAEIERLSHALDIREGGATEMGRVHDTAATLDYLTLMLDRTARERDASATEAERARSDLAEAEAERRAVEQRHDLIFARLEDAVSISMEPLENVFRSAGVDPDELIASVRKGYSGQGGPLAPIVPLSSDGRPDAAEQRANAILREMERIDLYRIGAWQLPLAMPVKAAVRYTSGFGGRDDPLGAGHRMHKGQDLAGAMGTPILSTADGVVTFAGWSRGYGQMVRIRHAFGIETLYGHLSRIRVNVGQKVSRGDRIGDMGSTGRSTGSHLHYEVHVGGTAVNPLKFMRAARNVF